MLTTHKYKKLLGSRADNMSEQEIEELQRLQHCLIKIAIRVWLKRVRKKSED